MPVADSTLPVLDTTASSLELTRQLCDIPSVSDDERVVADAIQAALEAAPHLEVIRDHDAVVARTHLGREKRVVIAGHIDTVPINDNVPSRLETSDEGTVLWGRGTVDMKAGVAVALKLAVELAEPVHDVTWIFYDHEEVGEDLNGLNRLLKTRPELLQGDFAILGEPSNAGIEGGCNGNCRIELRTHGLRAHSARSWVGHNAIHDLAPALAALAAYEPAQVEVDGLVYREGLNAVGISGGVAGNVIPDAATLHVNYRFAPSKSADDAVAHLRQVFPDYELEVVDIAEGARPGLTDPLALGFVAAVGGEPRAKFGWTDVARFSALGIPAVNYGPGDPMRAHADDERVEVGQIDACERGLRAWLSPS